MTFGEKLKTARNQVGLSQSALAKKAGVTLRSVQYYEAGQRQPQNADIILKLAEALSVPAEYFLQPEQLETLQVHDEMLKNAEKLYGATGRRQADNILDATRQMLAGGALTEEEELGFMQAINNLFFDAKRKSEKYTPKKYRREAEHPRGS